MRRFAAVFILVAGLAVWQRDKIKRWLTKQNWVSPDGSGLWAELSTSLQDLYGGDLFGDGRTNHVDRVNELENLGIVTFDHGVDNVSNEGVLLSDFNNTDVGTRAYLANLECTIAVNEYGLDPNLKPECESQVATRGYYGFTSNGVRMGVTLRPGVTSGPAPNIETNPDMQGDSGNWEEITG